MALKRNETAIPFVLFEMWETGRNELRPTKRTTKAGMSLSINNIHFSVATSHPKERPWSAVSCPLSAVRCWGPTARFCPQQTGCEENKPNWVKKFFFSWMRENDKKQTHRGYPPYYQWITRIFGLVLEENECAAPAIHQGFGGAFSGHSKQG